MSVDISVDSSLDTILTEVGGFGLFQFAAFSLVCIPSILTATYEVNYMISANTLDYRCKVSECDLGENNRDIPYNQTWLTYAIPSSNGYIDSCSRYAPKVRTKLKAEQCSADMFDTSIEIACTDFIYASDERNVQTEFNIHCLDSYKLALIGTVNSFARLLCLPFAGLLSDRFGRLTVVIAGLQLCSIFGVIKSFAFNYSMYITLEFLEASAGGCIFVGLYVLAIEWMNSKYRVLGAQIVTLSFSVGEILFGLLAMYVTDFRLLIRICYIPGLFIFTYFWLVPESIRWLLVTGRVDRALNILKRIAKVNRKELSEKSIEIINFTYAKKIATKKDKVEKEVCDESRSITQSICMILKSKKLCLRFIICCYQRAACLFGYFGLSLFSTHIPGSNRYISFVFVAAAEIPGALIALPLLNRMKRRLLLFTSLSIAAISIIITPFIPEQHSTIVLIFFLLSKTAMTCALSCLYVFTAEQWPTNIRTTVINSCAMVGQLGPIIAPMTVVLGDYYHALPAMMFAGTSLLAAILIVFNPETFGKKLPDTIEEAENI